MLKIKHTKQALDYGEMQGPLPHVGARPQVEAAAG
jgi:hypothetical protein